MTEPAGPPRGHIPEEQLLQGLDEWLEQQSTPPTIFDVVKSGNANVMAGFTLRAFRSAAREAVRQQGRVFNLRNLAYAAFNDPGAGEDFLRTRTGSLGFTPLEAAVSSSDGYAAAFGSLPPHVRAVALNLIARICLKWSLTEKEKAQLLGCSESVLQGWHDDPSSLPGEIVERIGLLHASYKALGTLLPKEEAANSWIKRPHHAPLFGGLSAFEIMVRDGTTGIRLVRDYLEAQVWSV
jgi:hypothetical protein